MSDLTGRVALITGAARGIGASTARTLCALGATVIVTDLEAPEELAHELGGHALRHDVSSEEDWIEAAAFANASTGGLDILVNNAGLFMMKPMVETTVDEWRHLHKVNVEGVFLGCKHTVPMLAARATRWRGGSAIVNISSVLGIVGSALVTSYNASKGAVRLFTKGLAIEVASHRIRVNSVHPGIIETDMGNDLVTRSAERAGIGGNDMRAALSSRHPLGQFGQPEDVANAVAFLASDRAAFITGTELIVDGGLSAQ